MREGWKHKSNEVVSVHRCAAAFCTGLLFIQSSLSGRHQRFVSYSATSMHEIQLLAIQQYLPKYNKNKNPKVVFGWIRVIQPFFITPPSLATIGYIFGKRFKKKCNIYFHF